MASFTVSYLHDDEPVTRVVCEAWGLPLRGRRLGGPAAFALGAAAVLALAEAGPDSDPSVAMRAIMLAPAALRLLLALGLPLVQRVLPPLLRHRLQRLPHRRVQVMLDDEGIDEATAHQRYRAVWSEVRAIRPLASLGLFRLCNGTQLVLPREAATPELAAWLARRPTSEEGG